MTEIEERTPDLGLRLTTLEAAQLVGGSPAAPLVETPTHSDDQTHLQTPNMGEQAPPDRSSTFDMAQMSNALPQAPFDSGEYTRGPTSQHHQGPQHMLDQVPHMAQYGHPNMSSQFYSPAQHVSQYYNEGASHRPGVNYYHQPHVAMGPTHASYYFQQPPGNYHAMGNLVHHQRAPGVYGGNAQASDRAYVNTAHDAGASSPSVNRGTETSSGAVFGPALKPQQSDHAIWIGNLPPQTDLMSLVQHVCKETAGLQSLFLISKSNCAFANYKEATESLSAQRKMHESRFQSVRLVSRLRSATTENTPGPEDVSTETGVSTESDQTAQTASKQDKFFILKSLTAKDLDTSVQKGVWATQSHNENVLNDAFQDPSVENVFLIFSANKSGEYFGYAKMLSPIDQNPAAAIEFAPSVQASSNQDAPKITLTEATEFMPRGRIVDDSLRGSVFWEIVVDEPEIGQEDSSEPSDQPSGAGQETQKAWGKPFQLEWLSTTRLPFHRCRGLRNPWNANREVKIARDGTELEPSVGRKLIALFNSAHVPGPMVPGGMMRAVPPMGPMAGYHHNMRPYGQ